MCQCVVWGLVGIVGRTCCCSQINIDFDNEPLPFLATHVCKEDIGGYSCERKNQDQQQPFSQPSPPPPITFDTWLSEP